ncbi:MAG: methylenetetrahydrofolate--tRNA-(uracil(54)-C(5))-methyltransferase (FADH(2)-oxidizing) TrmFO [Firmicutes bacterium]|nr:methylenetetrahydrofolate--tRNA-(uracil(54)-C(5))-methyltransferase (FADH(2)-oxidizing) TrmFO [Bacillota bacterium]
MRVAVVGGGFAGVEAAMVLARGGVDVDLWEMRPAVRSPAHQGGDLAEIVCSNSFGGDTLASAAGVLKAEMRALGSVVLEAAAGTAVPAGSALAVDREAFAAAVTARVAQEGRIRIVRAEATEPPAEVTVLAAGPLPGEALADWLRERVGGFLAFYDAASPIVIRETVDMSRAYLGSRYGREGEGDYVNCPLTEEEYDAFWQALVTAERTVLRGFEQGAYFESCLPVEVIAERGRDTLRFGPMRPVGLRDPRTGRLPYAVVQLRQDDAAGELMNLVGFQTGLRWREQKRVFRMVGALAQAEFARYGVMHKNAFVCAPRVLGPDTALIGHDGVYVTGQMAGVEGYMESAALGIYTGHQVLRRLRGLPPLPPPRDSMLGALVHYLGHADPDGFQPMNANFGLLPPPSGRAKGRAERKAVQAARALEAIGRYRDALAGGARSLVVEF